MKIYVIVSGEHDEFHIITATTNQILAEQIKEKLTKKDKIENINIEVYENSEKYLKNYYNIILNKEGNLLKIEKVIEDDDYSELFGYNSTNKFFYCYTVANNKEEAIEIAKENYKNYKKGEV